MREMLTPDPRYTFEIREDSDPIVRDGCLVRETWVENVYQIAESDFANDGVFLDLGANIGVVSTFARTRRCGRIIAVEPERENRELLRTNLERNKISDVEIVAAAVGGYNGQALISARRGNSQVVQEESPDTYSVPIATLATLLDAYAPNTEVDVMKFDIEGSEYALFSEVSIDTLNRIRYITGEFDGNADPSLFGTMMTKLCEYGNVHAFGAPSRGGYVFARRY